MQNRRKKLFGSLKIPREKTTKKTNTFSKTIKVIERFVFFSNLSEKKIDCFYLIEPLDDVLMNDVWPVKLPSGIWNSSWRVDDSVTVVQSLVAEAVDVRQRIGHAWNQSSKLLNKSCKIENNKNY